jgi:hypothetical protein
MRSLATLVALAALCACKSSAPYTVPAAAINTALAAGASVAQRSAGGCYSTCTHGTVCNPRTGFCDPLPCGGGCQAWELCVETEAAWRCVSGTAAIVTEKEARPAPIRPPVPVGVSPATGTTPTLPPAKATVEGP